MPLLASGGVQRTVPTAPDTAAPTSAAPPAIVVDHLSKHFRLPHQRYSTLKERALHPFRSRELETLRAVDDVSVEIGEGEFFGIVGRNGSGKSTLLKCLAGIYETTTGRRRPTRGRVSPFIELGRRLQPGPHRARQRDHQRDHARPHAPQAFERFDDVIAFAELEEFLDLKLKNYSSGMAVRLAFCVAVQVDADILLVDEVLAVGDASFQRKCFDQFDKLKAAGKTIVFVTHDMSAVERFCDRAMLLERGRIVELGDPHAVARAYNEINFGRLPRRRRRPAAGRRDPRRVVRDRGRHARHRRRTAASRCACAWRSSSMRTIAQPRFHFHLRNDVAPHDLRDVHGPAPDRHRRVRRGRRA